MSRQSVRAYVLDLVSEMEEKDAEIKLLREQLSEARATIERVKAFRDRPYREDAGMSREQYHAVTVMLDTTLPESEQL